MPRGKAEVGAMRGSEMTMRETPVSVLTAHTAPLVESATSTVVGFSVVIPFKNSASGSVAVSLISGVSQPGGKATW